jgi:hypothetical protein
MLQHAFAAGNEARAFVPYFECPVSAFHATARTPRDSSPFRALSNYGTHSREPFGRA